MDDYNHFSFIAEFERTLDQMGFFLKKGFDDTDKGGRFFEKNGKRNKAIGRYKYIPDYKSSSGNHLIIYTFFETRDKTGKLISGTRTEYFWHQPKGGAARNHKTQFDKEEYAKRRREAEKEALELQKKFSESAYKEYLELRSAYERSGLDVNNHKYLKRKNVLAGRGVILVCKNMKIESYYNQFKTDEKLFDFQYIKRNDLMVPAIDIDFLFRTYQKIDENGGKKQRIDITTVGAFYLLGEWNEETKRVYLVEGYATGYTIHRAMDDAVVLVCFDVNNVGVVLGLINSRYPNIEIIIGTDNDRKKSTKVGLYKGFEYSYIYNMPFIFPKFEDSPEYEELSDFNDLATVLLDFEIAAMIESQINFFKTYGKNQCIKWVAQSNGLSLDNLKEYAEMSKVNNLFSSLF
jgi:hypothetical protein